MNLNARVVHLVATLTPWLAPFPSAYFVARSSMLHLGVPLLVAAVIGATLECMGVATVHTALDAVAWNDRRHKTNDAKAPIWPLLGVGIVYLVATLGLVVLLETLPGLATYAPALFPFLSIVGAVNLAYIAQQRNREEMRAERLERDQTARGQRTIKKKEETKRKAKLAARGICHLCELEVGIAQLNEDGKCHRCDRSAEGKSHALPHTLSLQILQRDGWACYYCGTALRDVPSGERHLDHFIPRSQGGEDIAGNLVTSCAPCNLGKSDKIPSDLEQWDFGLYLKAKAGGSNKKEQILSLLQSNGDVKQADIARVLRTSQGYVSSVIKESDRGVRHA